MNIHIALQTDRQCKALTGVTIQEFEELVPEFSWNYEQWQYTSHPNRQRKVGGGMKSIVLPDGRTRLFLILMYVKTYPTYDVLAFEVGFSRSKACEWVLRLLPILEQTLGRKCVLPERQINSPEEFEKRYGNLKDVFVDGVERRTQRPKARKTQQKTYSGKKKAHTRKNIIVSNEHKQIMYLTKTRSGRRHDKQHADKVLLFTNLPKRICAWIDTGFKGVESFHPNVQMPLKKPRGRPLTPEEKSSNTLISSIRVKAEHGICGIKRMNSIATIARNHTPFMDDSLMMVAAGLWNYHLCSSE